MRLAMWKKSVITLLLHTSVLSLNTYSHENDDPVLTRIMLDQLELRDSNESPATLQAQAWIGKDLNKLWLKTEIDQLNDSSAYNSETQALYSHAISPFWDAQIGLMHSSLHTIKPSPQRNWGVIGLQGLAPYWFDVHTALFVGESNRIAARFSAEYELLFTQHLVLTPNIEVNVYGQNDAETGTGSGLSDIKTGMRLRYEIRREFAPYIGINHSKNVGNSATYAKNNGEAISDTELVIGLRAWL